MTAMTVLGEIGGWRYRGDFMPPGAMAVDGPEGADITVTRATVPFPADEAEPGHPIWRTLTGGQTLLSLPGIGRFKITGGNQVEIEPAASADPVTLGLLLSGPVLATLLRQRGLLPLDGAALGLNGGAVLIVGASGLGKSSLAAALAQKGWPVLGDGVLAVTPSTQHPQLVRGAPRLRLWRRTAQALGLDLTKYAPLRPGVARFDTVWGNSSPGPWPIVGVAVMLNRAVSPTCERLSPGRAMACLARSLWSRPAYGEDRTGAAALMADLAKLAASLPCWLLTGGEELETLDTTAALLESITKTAA